VNDIVGLCSSEQVARWRGVTDTVHEQGHRIFVRLTRCGRADHPYPLPDGALPLIQPAMPFVDVIRAIGDSVYAALNAMDAGFDGVELYVTGNHLRSRLPFDNLSSRAGPGSAGKRIRSAVEVIRAVSDAIGPDRTGVRLSAVAENVGTAGLFTTLARTVAPLGLAYVRLGEADDRDVAGLLSDERPRVLILGHAAAERTT
jgi:N-ethylmaleimide reductase